MTTCHRAHLVIGNHRFGRCLHIFTMATILRSGQKIPLNFTPGNILALKPTPLAKPPASFEFALGLHNEKGDILLGIKFSPGSILFNDHALRSLGDGFGEEHKVNMTHMDLKGRSLLQVKVSIHHYLTDSGFGRYQIVLDGITIAHFDQRIPGSATVMSYWVGTRGGPPSWNVDVYRIDDLLPEERLALGPGRLVNIGQYYFIAHEISGPPRHQFMILIQWQFLFGHPILQIKHTHPSVGTTEKRYVLYDIEGCSLFTPSTYTQIRLYYLGPRNFLHEFAYSASKNWYYGNLHTLNIVLHATSSIAAIRHNDDTTCIYYQGQ